MEMIQTADIGIIGAMKIEVEAICAAMADAVCEVISGMETVDGIANTEVVDSQTNRPKHTVTILSAVFMAP